MGALHSLYKPMPGKFKDYIAIPKINGYQSLHTTLVGPFGTPVEFQIRTRGMHQIAEAGVAAHWMYKARRPITPTISSSRRTSGSSRCWTSRSQTGDSQEFLEHVKIDLFPDAVYVFTPKGHITRAAARRHRRWTSPTRSTATWATSAWRSRSTTSCCRCAPS